MYIIKVRLTQRHKADPFCPNPVDSVHFQCFQTCAVYTCRSQDVAGRQHQRRSCGCGCSCRRCVMRDWVCAWDAARTTVERQLQQRLCCLHSLRYIQTCCTTAEALCITVHRQRPRTTRRQQQLRPRPATVVRYEIPCFRCGCPAIALQTNNHALKSLACCWQLCSVGRLAGLPTLCIASLIACYRTLWSMNT